MKKILTLAFAIAAMVFTGSVQAQSGSQLGAPSIGGFGGGASVPSFGGGFGGGVSAPSFGGGFGGVPSGVSSFGGFDGGAISSAPSFGGFNSGSVSGVSSYGGFGGYGGPGLSSYGGTSFGSSGSYGNYGLIGPGGPNDCGRQYTNQQAASLWGGYCTESCGTGGGCGLFGKKCGRKFSSARFGYPSGGCGHGGCGSRCGSRCGHGGCGGGCSQGCFGYPSCGHGFAKRCGLGGCGHKARYGGGHGGCCLLKKMLGKFHRGGAGSCSHCRLGGFRMFGGHHFGRHHGRKGCCLLGKCKSRKTAYAAITTYPVTTVAVDQCGCGSSGQYFDYAVGHEYGTAGMQSSVSGELTGACTSCSGSAGFDMGSPMGIQNSGVSTGPMVQQGLDMMIQ